VSACPRCGAALAPAASSSSTPTSTLPLTILTPAVPLVPAPRRPAAGERLLARYPQAGLRPQGPGARAYLAAVVLRNGRGTAAGIFAAWFNVPFVVLMAGVGGVVGGVAGVVSGTVAGEGVLKRIDTFLTWIFPLPVKAADLLPTAGAQIGGIIGGILGALNGAGKLGWMAFVWPWEQLYAGDPMWPVAVAVGQLVTALFVGVLYLAWSVFTEPLRLRVAGARRLSRREADWLMPVVQEAAGRLGLRALPRVLIDDRREANAHAGIRHIVINQGLIEQLDYDREQIGAVLAHELVHWRDGDAIAMVWARGVALPLYLVYELADRLLRLSRSRPLHFIVRFLFWSVIVTVRRFVIPVQATVWRSAEYRADAIAAAAGYGPGLRRALSYVRHSFDGERSGWDAAILATHPPTELRLEALQLQGRRYPLREDHPLVRALPGWTSRSTVEKDQ
jgi:Zn-dependent protease with chaperone function